MSLKFAAIGNLMALSAFEHQAEVEEGRKIFAPVEAYDPVLAMIGRGRQEPAARTPVTPASGDGALADQARW